MNERYVCKCGHLGSEHNLQKFIFQDSKCKICKECKGLGRGIKTALKVDKDYRKSFVIIAVLCIMQESFAISFIFNHAKQDAMISLILIVTMLIVGQLRYLQRRSKILAECKI